MLDVLHRTIPRADDLKVTEHGKMRSTEATREVFTIFRVSKTLISTLFFVLSGSDLGRRIPVRRVHIGRVRNPWQAHSKRCITTIIGHPRKKRHYRHVFRECLSKLSSLEWNCLADKQRRSLRLP